MKTLTPGLNSGSAKNRSKTSRRALRTALDLTFAGKRIQESTKSTSKTVAELAEQKRRRELELGISFEGAREELIRPPHDVACEYLDSYSLRHRSMIFAELAVCF